jgi:hypothetical protein
MSKLNWKQQETGRYRALASRIVGAVYFAPDDEELCLPWHCRASIDVRSNSGECCLPPNSGEVREQHQHGRGERIDTAQLRSRG